MNSFIVLHYWIIFFINNVPGTVSMDGGNAAVPGQFKYFVSIWLHHEYLCGGVIIDERHVLTVGHCVNGIPIAHLRVITGKTKLAGQNMEELRISSIWIHPHSNQVIDFVEPNKVYWTNDVAMIRLKGDLIWSSNVGQVMISRNFNDLNTGDEYVIPGWHNTTYGRKEVSLRWTLGKVLSKEQYIRLNRNPLLNAEYITGPVILNTDVGSPLICGNVVIGLIVQGGGTIEEPSIVLKLTQYYEFITAVINDGETKTDANSNEFAVIVSVWYQKSLICGGVIIDSTRILTASHCIARTYQNKFLSISYVHESNEMSEVQFVPVSKFENHQDSIALPGYHDYFYYNKLHDIAILKVLEPLKWSTSLRPAVFAREESTSRLYCYIFRWEPQKPSHLIRSSVALMDNMNELLIPNQFVVADGDLRSSSRLKNHGNPVICNGVVVGIIVNSFLNTEDWAYEPTIVLDIVPYTEFIRTTV